MNINRLFELAGLSNNDILLEAAYDPNITKLKNQFPNRIKEIDDNIKIVKPILVKYDRMIWYIKVLSAYLSNNINPVKGAYNFTTIKQFNDDLTHYYGYNIDNIKNTELTNQNISELFNTFQDYIDKYQKSDKPPVPILKGDYELIKFPDGTAWWYVNRSYCDEEGRSGKHCGNVVGQNNTTQRILSLRTPNNNVILTFIRLKNGYLGEMKAKANLKPSEKYHPQIMQLLLNPIVKGIKGAGYAPYMNFSIFDLSEQNIQVLINHNKESFIIDQIKAEPIEFLKAPDYIKQNKNYQDVALKKIPALQFVLNNEMSLEGWEKAIKKKSSLIIYAPESLHDFKNRIVNYLSNKPEDILKSPKSVSQNFEILSAVLKSGYGSGNDIKYIIPNTPRFKELCYIAIENRCHLPNIPEEYRTDEIYTKAVELDPTILSHLPETIKNYETICKNAVTKYGNVLYQVPERLRTFELCKLALIKSDGSAILYVPTTLKKYDDLCKISVTLNCINIKNIDKEYRTYELCKLAVEDASWVFYYVPTTINNYEEICKIAVTKNPTMLENIPHDLRTLELCKIAVKQDRYLLPLVPTNLQDAVKEYINESIHLNNYLNSL